MAHHKPVSKTQWMVAQKTEFLQLGKNLQQMVQHARKRYDCFIDSYSKTLDDNATILEIGCGPACIAQLINIGKKTYVDPLLDDIRRAYPNELPDGEYITGMAESIPRPDHSFDLILCFDTLSSVQNPELVLHEIKRLLKNDGSVCISITVWPKFFAQIHYLSLQVLPVYNTKPPLYRYTYQAITNTLSRHFSIIDKELIASNQGVLYREETWFFTCQI